MVIESDGQSPHKQTEFHPLTEQNNVIYSDLGGSGHGRKRDILHSIVMEGFSEEVTLSQTIGMRGEERGFCTDQSYRSKAQ